jgi:Arc/MetJ-type ribon-helix-helix transcriptional regulator
MEKTTIYLPLELRAQIKAAAHQEGRSQAEFIRDALRARFEHRERPTLRSTGIASDPGFSSEDIDEWLVENWRPEEDWGYEPSEDRAARSS